MTNANANEFETLFSSAYQEACKLVEEVHFLSDNQRNLLKMYLRIVRNAGAQSLWKQLYSLTTIQHVKVSLIEGVERNNGTAPLSRLRDMWDDLSSVVQIELDEHYIRARRASVKGEWTSFYIGEGRKLRRFIDKVYKDERSEMFPQAIQA